jgi:hypothetical protein
VVEPIGGITAPTDQPELKRFLANPFCPDPRDLDKKHDNVPDYEELDSISHTFDMLRDSNFPLRNAVKPSQKTLTSLPPCTWETVKMSHVSAQLYSFSQENANKIRLTVGFEPEVDVYADQLAYTMLALLNNSFGYLGLYIGIGVMELVMIVDTLLNASWKGHLLKERT